jgi:peptidoglycan/xylan/chitin deacetylase (PgdA/CDA1 family)
MQRTALTSLLLRHGKWQGAIVLSYHRIGDAAQSDLNRSLWTPASRLDAHLRFLRQWFDIVSPDQLRPELLSRFGRRVVVTFDDGYRDLYEAAYPVLEANGVRATMFLCAGFLDRAATAWWDEIAWMVRHRTVDVLRAGPWSAQPIATASETLEHVIDRITRAYWTCEASATDAFLEALATATGAGRRPPAQAADDWITWEMAREMRTAGHLIGAHTVTHPVLARMAPAAQKQEIEGSLERLEARLGERPRLFAYPVGGAEAFTEETKRALIDAGIELAFSNYGGRVTRKTFSPLDVRRTSAETLRTPELLSSMLALPAVFGRA